VKAVRRSTVWLSGALVLLLTSACASGTARTSSLDRAEAKEGTAVLTVAPMDVTGSAGRFESLTSKAATSSLPKRLMVYRVKPANVTKSAFEKRARGLGLKGAIEETTGRFLIADEGTAYEVDRATGSFDYTTEAFAKQTQPLQHLLSDNEYRKKAEAFLTGSGLMEDSAEFRDVNRGNVVGTYENGRWVERPFMIEARFGHKQLGGIDFDKGVGPKIVVQFGEDGRILGALSVWREVEPFSVYALKSTDEALTAAKKGDAQLFNVEDRDTGVVDTVSLSYINDPLDYDQRYVLPAYILKGSTGNGSRFVGVARAIPEALLRVDASLRGPTVSAPLSTGK